MQNKNHNNKDMHEKRRHKRELHTEIELSEEAILSEVAGIVSNTVDGLEGETDLHHVRDVLEGLNREIVTTEILNRFRDVVNILYPYTKRRLQGGILSAECGNSHGGYVLCLKTSTERSSTTMSYLQSAVKEYIVCSVVGKWFDVTIPTSKLSATWVARAEEARNNIVTSMTPYNANEIRVRPSMFY